MSDPTQPMPPHQPDDQAAMPPHSAPTPAPPFAAQPQNATVAGSPSPNTPAKRSNARAWTVGGIALVIALCCGGIGIAALSNGDPEPAADAASSAAPSITTADPTSAAPTTSAPTTAPASTAPALPLYDTPAKSDFKLKVKILRKQCFGSAGCNVTYRIDVTYTGSGLDPSKTYEVTYQVKGAEDPIINTFEVTGDSASVQEEEMASTKRSGDKLTAAVTDVAEF
ncbi:hypothetical protein ABZV78_03195 [Micromonospora sp. NPDC004540]|uniref:hypothetical protein n=1 Tax=Micromonospora sp. NPDC004540 TaxID=3154457 RepID=UPI0033AEB1BA